MRIDVYAEVSAAYPHKKNQRINAWLRAHFDDDTQPRIIKKKRGQPSLAPPHQAHAISITHTHDALMLAVANNVPWVGLDAECQSRRITHNVSRLAKRYFHPNEYQTIDALANEEQNTAFLKLWTMKEALLKGLGHGLSGLINRVCFSWTGNDWVFESTTIKLQHRPEVLRLPFDGYLLALAYASSGSKKPDIHLHYANQAMPQTTMDLP